MLSFSFLVNRVSVNANNLSEVKELLTKAYAVNVFAQDTNELTASIVTAVQKHGFVYDGQIKTTAKGKPYMSFKQKGITAADLA
jgi:hypothetical protein